MWEFALIFPINVLIFSERPARLTAITKFNLDNFPTGWVAGNFSPAVLSTEKFEFGVKSFSANQTEPCHFQKSAVELTVVIAGRISIGGVQASVGEIIVVPPGVHGGFVALTDCQLAVLKSPSAIDDKVMCGDSH